MGRKGFLLAGITGFGTLLVLFLISPSINPEGSFLGLDGSPGVIDHGWNGLSAIGYTIGDFLCHQESDRCFILNGNQIPICIRDTGLLLGVTIGLIACIPLGTKAGERMFPLIGVVLVAVTGVEWVLESSFGDMPVARFSTGVISGIGAALILCWMLYRENDGETGRHCA